VLARALPRSPSARCPTCSSVWFVDDLALLKQMADNTRTTS